MCEWPVDLLCLYGIYVIWEPLSNDMESDSYTKIKLVDIWFWYWESFRHMHGFNLPFFLHLFLFLSICTEHTLHTVTQNK